MGHYCCCVVNCKNTSRNSQCKFYVFPTAPWKLDQRMKWIAAVRRKNVDGSPWYPKPYDKICSEHFIGGKKSDAQASPSYVPMIFNKVYGKRNVNESQVQARYKRLIKRKTTEAAVDTAITAVSDTIKKEIIIAAVDTTITEVSDTIKNEIIITEEENNILETQPRRISQGCEANIFSEIILRETTFICNRFIYTDHCDAEIQVGIATHPRIITTSNPRKKDKSCGTVVKTFQDQCTETTSREFTGISSIKHDSELLDIAGVSFSNFNFLLTKLNVIKCTVSIKDRLLIFLMKLKTDLTFSALSVLFGIHRSTISRIFHSIMKNFVSVCAKRQQCQSDSVKITSIQELLIALNSE